MVQSVYSNAWAALTGKAGTTATAPLFASKAASSGMPNKAETASANASTAPVGDTVAVSKLGKALSGLAAKAFEHLDSDSKKQLEGLVESGRVSADDAVKGLRSLAKNALFNRFVTESGHSAEEQQMSDRMKVAHEQSAAAAKATENPDYWSALKEMDQLGEARKNGSVSQEEVSAMHRSISERLKGTTPPGAIHVSDEERSLMGAVFTSKANRFADLNFGDDDRETSSTTDKIASKDELDAADRLFAVGFKLENNAMARFAADYDIPGLGKGTMPAWFSFKPVSR
ncbi:hypothetical protein GBZ48_23055 [Azospirillum melinis]|uniref:Uncharacterized protein n=1 Tax=Azospirillum melinis TaxID=328839 RepID=A0ABX2KQI6_9PROT|nr:hypothetical protein [Azospirillum melinis]MBP2306954.1 hypothetical protein [Azospirillum melinis]NUB02124.1 hypothetical protein [Azospirillum melinis]